MRLNFCPARGVWPSRNSRSADLITVRLILNRALSFSHFRPNCTPRRIPSDLNNMVNGWSYE